MKRISSRAPIWEADCYRPDELYNIPSRRSVAYASGSLYRKWRTPPYMRHGLDWRTRRTLAYHDAMRWRHMKGTGYDPRKPLHGRMERFR